MKVAFSALLATVLGLSLVVGEAQAATKKKAAKKSAAKATTSATQLPAKVEAAAPAPAPTVATEPAQTSAAPIATAVTEAEPKRWGMLIDIWAEGQVHGMNRSSSGGAEAGSETMLNSFQIRPSYKITDTASVAAGIDVEHSFGSQGKADQDGGVWTTYDAFVQVAHSKLLTLGPVNLRGYLRPYLPTSEASQNPDSGRYLALRGNLSAKAPIGGGFNVSYTVEPRYFMAKNASYKTYKPDGSLKAWKATEDYRVKHWLGLDYENGKFSGYTNWGIKSQMYNQDSDADTGAELTTAQKDQLYSETGIGYQLIENFALNVGYYTETNNFRDNNAWVAFDDKEFLYFVEGVVTF
jgi:hypothetical protein